MNIAVYTSWYSLLSNLALMIIKLVAGLVGQSFALVADAIESAGDVVSSVFLILGINYAQRPPDQDHPYGHGRAEPLLTFIIVVFLFVSAIFIGYRSIQNILYPDGIVPEMYTIWVLAGIIIWKELSFRWLVHKNKSVKSSVIKADAWHHRSDAITSVAALVGIAIALVGGPQYAAADDWAALVASLIIIYNAYLIFKPALSEAMDEHLYQDIESEVRRIAMTVPGVSGTEKCIIRKSGTYYHIDLHALVDGGITVTEGHNIAHAIIDAVNLQLKNAGHINIHIEPHDYHYGGQVISS